jgi:ADP-ribose pyrophosphatase YjhB (NUDIX family)
MSVVLTGNDLFRLNGLLRPKDVGYNYAEQNKITIDQLFNNEIKKISTNNYLQLEQEEIISKSFETNYGKNQQLLLQPTHIIDEPPISSIPQPTQIIGDFPISSIRPVLAIQQIQTINNDFNNDLNNCLNSESKDIEYSGDSDENGNENKNGNENENGSGSDNNSENSSDNNEISNENDENKGEQKSDIINNETNNESKTNNDNKTNETQNEDWGKIIRKNDKWKSIKKKKKENYYQRKITSYGLLCFKIDNGQIKILLIRRKHSMEFVIFMLGDYDPNNFSEIEYLFREMSTDEKKMLTNETFENIWDSIWFKTKANCYRKSINKKESKAKKIFEHVKTGYNNSENIYIKLSILIEENKSLFDAPEWTLPKGKKNNVNESCLDCAIRETTEETNLHSYQYDHLSQIKPLTEQYYGDNGIIYKYVYHVCRIKTTEQAYIDPNNLWQQREVGDIGYFSIDECLRKMRTNLTDKIKIFSKLKCYLRKYYNDIINGAIF